MDLPHDERTSRIRTRIVSATIDHAHGRPDAVVEEVEDRPEKILERRERAGEDHA
jgi:hypothetical protein